MAKQKYQPPEPERDLSPGELAPARPGEPIPRPDPGLVDPRHFSPAPGDPSPGVHTPLEVVPLSGPTEASADNASLVEPDDQG